MVFTKNTRQNSPAVVSWHIHLEKEVGLVNDKLLSFALLLLVALPTSHNEQSNISEVRQVPDPEFQDQRVTSPTAVPAYESLLQELVGFGRFTTGGQGGNMYTVTSLADSGPGTLRDALTGSATPLWIRFGVSGTIHLNSNIITQSNKTIDGRGADITINGYGIFLQNGASNLIVNNIKLTNALGDALHLYNGSRRMWVHHCDISNAGDGAFDATENSNEVTVSYTHIFNQNKAMLVGAGSDTGNGAGMNWTAHHNWYQNVVQRLPKLRMGRAHSYNNLFNWISGTAIEATMAPAQFFSENDILEPLSNVNNKLILVQDGGASRFQGAWQKPYPGGTLNIINTGTVFDPHAEYNYTPDVADSALEAHIETNAGWRNVPWPTDKQYEQAESASGQTLFAPFAVVSDATASGSKYITSTISYNSIPTASTDGQASYTCKLKGTVAIWIRMYAPSLSEDSFWVSYDGGSYASFFNTGANNQWVWQKWGEAPASGNNILRIVRKEANTRFDRVLFTTDLTYTPTGTGF
jgi:pectate lyase